MPDIPHDVGPSPDSGTTATRLPSRRLLWFIGTLGIVALVFGGIQLQRTIRDPFSSVARFTSTQVQPQDQALLALKAKDTDGDGLSDYDELYLYNTSPYIADSDSDSVSDGQEIQRGTDPNCPEGKSCGVIAASNSNAPENVNAPASTNTAAQSSANAQQLRDALIAAGVPKTQLDSVDDATLLSSYQSVLAEEQATNANGNNNAPVTNTTTPTTQDLQNLSAPEIRQLLITNGVDATALSQYDDATLKAVYLQALQEENSSTNANTNAP